MERPKLDYLNRFPLQLLVVFASVFPLISPAFSQTEEALAERIEIEAVRELREQIAQDATLGEDLSARVLALYDTAISALENAERSETQVQASERQLKDIGQQIETLKEALRKPREAPSYSASQDTTANQVEAELTKERSALNAYRTALRQIQGLIEERTRRRNEIARRLGTLDQQIEALIEQRRTTGQAEMQPQLKEATRYNLAAQQQAYVQEIQLLRAEMALLDERAKLIPWQRDQARRRVRTSEKLVTILEDVLAGLKRSEAEEQLNLVLEQSSKVNEEVPALADIASETEEFARMLLGPDGVEQRSQLAVTRLIEIRRHTTELERVADLTRRRFEAFGHGSVTRWWPEVPEDFPTSNEVLAETEERELLIPEIQHKLIELEQLRAEIGRLERKVGSRLAEEGIEAGSDKAILVASLLDTRRDLLDTLVTQYGRFSSQLVELDTISRNFLTRVEAVESFLYDKLIWVRSVPKPIIPRLSDMASALLWFLSPTNLGDALVLIFDLLGLEVLVWLVLFGALIGLRPWLLKRLRTLARRVGSSDSDSFYVTLESYLHTLLIAAPLPFALIMTSIFLLQTDRSAYLNAAGLAFYYTGGIAALLEITRQLLRPKGLAESHFGWDTELTSTLHKGLLLPESIFLPLTYVSLHFAWAGLNLESPEQLQLYNNSLGRVLFIAALLVLGVSLSRLLKPRGRSRAVWRRGSVIAAPFIALSTVVPAILAALGYYLTGFLLAYQMLRTAWLALLLLLIAGLASRWRATRGTRKPRTVMEDGSVVDTLTEIRIAQKNKEDLRVAEVQVRRLNRFVIIVIAAIGLYSIWADALPVLQGLKRVQVWPTVALLPPEGTAALPMVSTESAAPSTGGDAQGADSQEGAAAGLIPGAGAPSGATTDTGGSETSSLTLWKILEALLAAIITYVLTKNLPGLIELLLLRRTMLDSGARIAVSTLVRYVVLIFGVSATFSLLGLTWSKVQWLAAALTFGLGFGLQEIVANFVSGLILLVERPIRVGDAVSIGELQGRVTRTHIRATTITLWDRSEMIVPNKEFITTKLVNWTLSDSKRRIDIPVRVAYGSDIQKVKDVLMEVAEAHPHVLEEPEANVLLIQFMDDAMKFELRIFVDFGRGLKTKDELQVAIDQAFTRHGIEFAMPLLSIQLPETEGSEPKQDLPPKTEN